MTDDRDLAIERWVDWAIRDAKQVSREDWHRLVASWADLEPDEMGDVIAGLSDGELVRLHHATEHGDADASVLPWPARAEVIKLRRLVDEEIPRRILGGPAEGRP